MLLTTSVINFGHHVSFLLFKTLSFNWAVFIYPVLIIMFRFHAFAIIETHAIFANFQFRTRHSIVFATSSINGASFIGNSMSMDPSISLTCITAVTSNYMEWFIDMTVLKYLYTHPSPGPQEIRTWGAMLISGHWALRAILIRSDRDEVAAWAQHEPQY